MKELKLKELNLVNFKGIKDFSLKSEEGNNIDVFGRNATGKTTIFDGFVWLLFGKDSMNRSKFDIKTLDDSGDVKEHGLDHEVEGIFEMDGQEISFKRVYAETWTKKSGYAEKEFTGHTNKYYIDGVPSNKKEYTEKIEEIISEDVFKLLTNPMYFNEQLGWKERRELLLKIAGKKSDSEIAEASNDKDLIDFIHELNGRDVEDQKKVIMEKRKEINSDIEKIPVRIDELTRSIPEEVEKIDVKELDEKMASLDKQISEKNDEINSIKSGAEINNKKKELSDIELEISQIKNKHEQGNNEKIFKTKSSIQETDSNIKLLKQEKDSLEDEIKSNEDKKDELDEKIKELRETYSIKSAVEFSYEEETSCPTCKQSLPEDQVEEARNKALETFNQKKSDELEEITEQALKFKEDMEKLDERNDSLTKKIDKLTKDINSYDDKLNKLNDELNELENETTSIEDDISYKEKTEQKQAILDDIKAIEDTEKESIEKVKSSIEMLEETKKEVNQDYSKIEFKEQSEKRLDELKEQEKNLSIQREKTDRDLHLIEQFTRTKVDVMEKEINNKFEHARFKLFEEQINGGLKETCVTTYGGVPYNSGLNNSARINIGLDIINTLSNHYDVRVPIFVDNAEAVNEMTEVKSQLITLTVSDDDKLTVK